MMGVYYEKLLNWVFFLFILTSRDTGYRPRRCGLELELPHETGQCQWGGTWQCIGVSICILVSGLSGLTLSRFIVFLGLEKPDPYCSWSCLTGQIRCWWGQIFYPLLPSTIRSDPDSEEKNIRRTKPRRERTKALTCHCIKNKERKPSLALLSSPPRTRQNSLAEMTEVKFLSLSLSFFLSFHFSSFCIVF